MSDLELLGALVGPTIAENLLSENDGSLFQLFGLAAVDHRDGNADRYCVREAAPQDGWHRARFVLDAARELVSRGFAQSLRHRDALSSPRAVRDHLKTAIAHLQYEVFIVLFLDAQNRLIASRECFRGTLTQTSVYPREIVKLALEYGAEAVILCHNHPSGTAEPSPADRTLTELLKKALSLVDVRVVDHFIIAGDQAYSFAEHGLI
jgi:DNA repair protein RadC